MKKIKKIIGFTKRYNIIVIFILVLLFSSLGVVLLTFAGVPPNITGLLPVFGVGLFCVLLELKLLIRIYVLYRFIRIKFVKNLSDGSGKE